MEKTTAREGWSNKMQRGPALNGMSQAGTGRGSCHPYQILTYSELVSGAPLAGPVPGV